MILKVFFRAKLPEKDEFVVKFSELEYSSKKTKHKAIVKYTLSKLLQSNSSGLTIDYENLTIEHMLSESTLKEDSEAKVASIGNLILLDQKTNSEEVADRAPEEKFKILKDKKYPMDQVFIESELWANEQILERTKKMAVFIYNDLRARIV